jgi:hypothetical protein
MTWPSFNKPTLGKWLLWCGFSGGAISFWNYEHSEQLGCFMISPTVRIPGCLGFIQGIWGSPYVDWCGTGRKRGPVFWSMVFLKQKWTSLQHVMVALSWCYDYIIYIRSFYYWMGSAWKCFWKTFVLAVPWSTDWQKWTSRIAEAWSKWCPPTLQAVLRSQNKKNMFEHAWRYVLHVYMDYKWNRAPDLIGWKLYSWYHIFSGPNHPPLTFLPSFFDCIVRQK